MTNLTPKLHQKLLLQSRGVIERAGGQVVSILGEGLKENNIPQLMPSPKGENETELLVSMLTIRLMKHILNNFQIMDDRFKHLLTCYAGKGATEHTMSDSILNAIIKDLQG